MFNKSETLQAQSYTLTEVDCHGKTDLDQDKIPVLTEGTCQIVYYENLGYICRVARGECPLIALTAGTCNAHVVVTN
jgi:hypothetical protein